MKRTDDWSDSARGRAFEAAVAPHMDALRDAALRILPSHDLAWDAVQETLIRAWRYPELPAEPRGVLISLVRSSCLHILRCARRRSDHEHGAHEVARQRCCSMDPTGSAHEPDASAELRDEIRAVEAAAARLTREHREVLEMVAWQGLSYREAAGALQLPLGTVRSRTSRARTALMHILNGDARMSPLVDGPGEATC